MNLRLTFCTTVFSLLVAISSQAAFHSRLGGQAYYDDQLDITWAANANINGAGTWDNQMDWASTLSIDGVTGWRLPDMDVDNDGTVVGCTSGLGQAGCKDNEYGHLYYYGAGTSWANGVRHGSPGSFTGIQPFNYWSNTTVPTDDAWSLALSNGTQEHYWQENVFFAWAVHDGDVNPVSIVDVTYDSPVIGFGPLSFGLAELPAEPEVTFLLNDGTPAGGGATSYGLGDVLSADLVFGDVIGPNHLTAFAMEVLANGSIDTLSYTFSPIDTPSVSGGGIVMNSPLFISGTDIASGQAFSYTYANSVETITAVPGPGDFNGDLLVNGADFLKWQQGFGDSYDASHLTEWEENFGEVPGPVVAAIVSTPEPSTLLLSCLAGVAFCWRRR